MFCPQGCIFRKSSLAKGILFGNLNLGRQWLPGEWPSGLYSLCQVTEVKLGRVRSNSGWVTSEA